MSDLIGTAMHKLQDGASLDGIRRWLEDLANKGLITWVQASETLIAANKRGGRK